MNEVQEATELQHELFETKSKMKQEVDRLHKSEQVLAEDKNSLLQANDTYKQFGDKLTSNFQKFISIKRKAERETLLLWYSFYLLVLVSLYIILRRLGIFRIFIQKPLSLALKTTQYTLGLLNQAESKNPTKSEL